MPPQASDLVTYGILVLSLLMSAVFVAAQIARAKKLGLPLRRAALGSALGVIAWLTLTGVAAGQGLLSRWEARPPPMAFMFVAVPALGMALGLSRVGAGLGRAFPLALLVGVQGFRLPLELVMHQAAVEGTMPEAMSYGGYNFDIATGVTALLVAALLFNHSAPRWLVWAWNVLGISCLVVIFVVAFASTPLVHAFGNEPRQLNTWVAYFPFVWLPAVLVTFAIAGHVIVTRRLLWERGTQPRVAADRA
jgi:hypothetical protein